MRRTLLASATLLTIACSLPAFAQPAPDSGAAAPPDAGVATDTPAATGTTPPKPIHHSHRVAKTVSRDGETFAHEPGTGESGPASMKASNIDQATTHSSIAPHLPQPPGGLNAGWRNYLRDADRAIAMHKTGMAQQSLEMAETRLLDRSTSVDTAGQANSTPMIQQVAEARRDLASGNMAGARAAIRTALARAPQGEESSEGMGSPGMAAGGTMPAGAVPEAGMTTSQPGGAPMGNGMPSSGTMAPSGAGPAPGHTAGAAVGGGPAATGTADSAGGAK